jgi:catechol 2,3-dioxygenase-like lactoylglutathione lyase family enzyme
VPAAQAQQQRDENPERDLKDTRRAALLKMSFSTAVLSATMDFFAFKAFAQSVGILDTRKAELKDVLSTLEQSPEDELALSEKSLLEGQIKSIESNIGFLDKTRPLVEAGEANFLQHAVLEVSDVDAAVKFWTEGLGMKVNRSRSTNGTKQAFVSFGPETLKADNGGMFALELIEKKGSKQDNSGQFFQFALPNSLRVNRLYEAGGEITFGYGYFEIDAPDGYKVVAYIDRKRDPFDLIGVYVDDIDGAASYYENVFGMKADKAYAKQRVGRFDPVRPKGSVLMTYRDPKDNTGILLIPQKGKKQSIKIAVLDKDVYERKQKLEAAGVTPDFVGPVPGIGTKVALVQPSDGVPIVFVDYQDFEKEQPTPTVLSIKEEIEAFVAMAKELENAETVNVQ